MARLVVLTTCGNVKFLEQALNSLFNETADIIVIDDGSKTKYDNLKKKCAFNVIKKKKGKGLTHSWNMAYKIFKDNYDRCVLSNDDVIFPGRVPPDMWNGLKKYKLIGPLSDPVGSGKFKGNFQNIDSYLRVINDYKEVLEIQNRLQKLHPHKRFLELGKDIEGNDLFVNGFCFSFDKKIIESEYSKDILFNPEKINVGNEKEHQKYRLLNGRAISIKSYVYHYKGQTFSSKDRQEIVND